MDAHNVERPHVGLDFVGKVAISTRFKLANSETVHRLGTAVSL